MNTVRSLFTGKIGDGAAFIKLSINCPKDTNTPSVNDALIQYTDMSSSPWWWREKMYERLLMWRLSGGRKPGLNVLQSADQLRFSPSGTTVSRVYREQPLQIKRCQQFCGRKRLEGVSGGNSQTGRSPKHSGNQTTIDYNHKARRLWLYQLHQCQESLH